MFIPADDMLAKFAAYGTLSPVADRFSDGKSWERFAETISNRYVSMWSLSKHFDPYRVEECVTRILEGHIPLERFFRLADKDVSRAGQTIDVYMAGAALPGLVDSEGRPLVFDKNLAVFGWADAGRFSRWASRAFKTWPNTLHTRTPLAFTAPLFAEMGGTGRYGLSSGRVITGYGTELFKGECR